MKLLLKLSIIVNVLILTLSGCSKGGGTTPDPVPVPDTTKPVITITKPTAGQIFSSGNTILFQANFSDNIGLKNYDIAVSKKLTGGMILKVVPTSVNFSYTKSSTGLSGKTQDISLSDIAIPANTATQIVTPGVYNFVVTCNDSSNNAVSTTLEITIN